MLKVTWILEYDETILDYLLKRNIIIQYKKAKQLILEWHNVSLRIREPKKDKIYYFRINKQYRAFCKIKDWFLIVFKIDNHQN